MIPSNPEKSEQDLDRLWEEMKTAMLRLSEKCPGNTDLELLFDLLNEHILGMDEFCVEIEGFKLQVEVGDHLDQERLFNSCWFRAPVLNSIVLPYR